MKLTYTKDNSTVRFEDISPGECFFDKDGHIYMKIRCGYEYIAVCFGDNMTYTTDAFFGGVHPVGTELLIHSEKH